MKLGRLLKILLPTWLVGGMMFANCTGEMAGRTVDDGTGDTTTVPPGCDPDQGEACPATYFTCTQDAAGNKHCEEEGATPDGGEWVCSETGGTMTCTGDHMPGEDSGWECVDNGDGSVTCSRHSYVPSDSGDSTEGEWNCWYEGDTRICEFVPGEGGGDADVDSDTDADTDSDSDIDEDGFDQCPPGQEVPVPEVCDDGRDNDCDGQVDEDCPPDNPPPPDDCECVPGAQRFCDTPDYCHWGIQFCDADGIEWGDCSETVSIPPECMIDGWYSPASEACCVAQGYCCQDMWDINGNGDNWESLGNCVDIVCQ